MKIAFLASECAPYLKTGGLGDVVQALPEALSKLPKVEVSVFLPYYRRIKYSGQWKTDFLGYFDVQLAWRREYVGIFRLKTRKKKLQVYFLDNEQYFNRPSAYGYPDDGERFAYFSRACLESLRYLGMQPDIVHCHDWQTALVPMLLNMQYRGDFPNMRSILTIHNIEYQGKCGLDFNRDVLGAPPQCDETASRPASSWLTAWAPSRRPTPKSCVTPTTRTACPRFLPRAARRSPASSTASTWRCSTRKRTRIWPSITA